MKCHSINFHDLSMQVKDNLTKFSFSNIVVLVNLKSNSAVPVSLGTLALYLSQTSTTDKYLCTMQCLLK